MIRCYLLPVIAQNGTETVPGISIIHDALLLGTDTAMLRRLIMDTTDDEDLALIAAGATSIPATDEDIELYNTHVEILPPDPDTIRAEEILENSPDVITQPEMWELVRIFGRRLGYRW